MAEHLFLTGGTGFIGSRILRSWIERTDAAITLIVRGQAGDQVADRVRRLVWTNPTLPNAEYERRVRVVSGDLTAPGLGLAASAWSEIAATATHIVHAGAEVSFNLSLESARETNTAGTAAVLGLARECRRLELLSYVGTAYAAGRRQGVVAEEEAEPAVDHNNTYEQSKYEAEQLVRTAMSELPAVVLRPSIVTCDLQTGYSPANSAFFRVLQAIGSGALKVLPGRPGSCLDLVPVDYVVEGGFALARRPELAGRCFHLGVGFRQAFSLGDLVELACRHFRRDPVQLLPGPEFRRWAAAARVVSPAATQLLNEIEQYEPYLNNHPAFDNANAKAALAGVSLPTVVVSDYFDLVVAHVRRAAGGGSR